jgi:hypothetical protein
MDTPLKTVPSAKARIAGAWPVAPSGKIDGNKINLGYEINIQTFLLYSERPEPPQLGNALQ